jgi:hypothetical protein
MDAFHDELHYLPACEQSPEPTENYPQPGVTGPAHHKIRNELPAARRQNCGESRCQVLSVLPTQIAAHHSESEQQAREKNQEHIESYGLGDHAALGNDSGHRTGKFFRK